MTKTKKTQTPKTTAKPKKPPIKQRRLAAFNDFSEAELLSIQANPSLFLDTLTKHLENPHELPNPDNKPETLSNPIPPTEAQKTPSIPAS